MSDSEAPVVTADACPPIYRKALSALVNNLTTEELVELHAMMDSDHNDGMFELITLEVYGRRPDLF